MKLTAMARAGTRFAASLLAAWITAALVASEAYPHDMALSLFWTADGALEGQLRYSDAKAAEGNFVRIAVSGATEYSVLALQTDAAGRFRAPLRSDFAYEVTASGEEGHEVAAHIAALDSRDVNPASARAIPVYLVLALILLLSLPLAKRLRRPGDGVPLNREV